MLKILQARLQQYVTCELPDGQTGFKKGRGTRDKIAEILEPGEGLHKPKSLYMGLLLTVEYSPNTILQNN